jgi:hypothetical protein
MRILKAMGGSSRYATRTGAGAWARVSPGLVLLAGLLALAPLASAGQLPSQCQPAENLLRDSEFATVGGNGGPRVWSGKRHAKSGSFETRAEDGILTIAKIGPEPWFYYTQKVKTAELGGKTVRYTAQLKLDTTEPVPPHSFNYESGLYLTADNLGRRTIFRSLAEQTPRFGQSDWFEASLEFQLPDSAATLAVGFLHQAGGSFQVERPTLVIVNDNACKQ